MVWLNFGKSLLYTRFFLATLVRGPKDFTMFLQKVGGGEESPWLPSTVSVTKVPEPVEGPRTPSPRGTPLKPLFLVIPARACPGLVPGCRNHLFYVIASQRRSNPFLRLYYIFP